jgi:hypothetical protein
MTDIVFTAQVAAAEELGENVSVNSSECGEPSLMNYLFSSFREPCWTNLTSSDRLLQFSF